MGKFLELQHSADIDDSGVAKASCLIRNSEIFGEEVDFSLC